MRKIFCLLPTLLIWANSISAQNDSIPANKKPVKTFKISTISANTAMQTELSNELPASDFLKLIPNSDLLSSDFNEYPDNQFNSKDIKYAVINILMGIKFGNKKKNTYRETPLFRIGLNASNGSILKDSYSKNINTPIDTFESVNNGETLYVDSLWVHTYTMDFNSKQINIDGSFILRTNQQRKASFYSGIGFTTGISFNAETSINYSEKAGREYYFPYGGAYFQYYENLETEYTDKLNKIFMRYSVYIPIGLEIKAWGKSDFWQHAHIFYELRFGISYISLPNVETVSREFVQHGFGLKYSLN